MTTRADEQTCPLHGKLEPGPCDRCEYDDPDNGLSGLHCLACCEDAAHDDGIDGEHRGRRDCIRELKDAALEANCSVLIKPGLEYAVTVLERGLS